MDEGLFQKYNNQINKQKNEKSEIVFLIKEKTGIELDEKSITVSKKEIKINTTSVLKQKLFQKNITDYLKQKGYTLK